MILKVIHDMRDGRTRVIDPATGEELEHVLAVTFEQDARHGSRRAPRLTILLDGAGIDVIAEATSKRQDTTLC